MWGQNNLIGVWIIYLIGYRYLVKIKQCLGTVHVHVAMKHNNCTQDNVEHTYRNVYHVKWVVQTSFFIKRLSEFTGIKKLFHFFRVTYFEHSEGYLSLFTYRLLPFITFLYFFLVHEHNFQYKKKPSSDQFTSYLSLFVLPHVPLYVPGEISTNETTVPTIYI